MNVATTLVVFASTSFVFAWESTLFGLLISFLGLGQPIKYWRWEVCDADRTQPPCVQCIRRMLHTASRAARFFGVGGRAVASPPLSVDLCGPCSGTLAWPWPWPRLKPWPRFGHGHAHGRGNDQGHVPGNGRARAKAMVMTKALAAGGAGSTA